MVFSAGNDTASVAFPATVPEAITVGAITRSGALAVYSNTGPEVDLVAPSSSGEPILCGEDGDIVTTDNPGIGGCDDGPGGELNYMSTFGGTSAAAPQVSAAAALLISDNSMVTAAGIRDSLTQHADPWGDSDEFGAGKLDVGALFYDGGGGGGARATRATTETISSRSPADRCVGARVRRRKLLPPQAVGAQRTAHGTGVPGGAAR